MKVLLTGANGQVGYEMQRLLPKLDVEWVAFDRSQLDISNPEQVVEMIALHQPTIVVNAAAYTAVDRAEQERDAAFVVNAEGPANLARACKAHQAALIHISTDYVFDGLNDLPYTEADAVKPLGVYGASKWQGEVAIAEQLPQHIILRTSWVFGVHGNNFVKTILRLAKEREVLKIVADQKGSPTGATSIAVVIGQLIQQLKQLTFENAPWGIYHYTDGPESTWYDFAKEIVALNQTKVRVSEILPITTADYQTLAQRPAYSVLSCKKIMTAFAIQQADWRKVLQDVSCELT